MYGMIQPTGGPGRGLFPGHMDARCDVKTNLAKDDVVMLDFAGGTNGDPGDNSVFSTVIQCTNALGYAGIFGLMLEAADGSSTATSGRVLFAGFVEKGPAPSGASKGDRLIADDSGNMQIADDAGDLGKVIAILTEDEASGEADMWFNGIDGFGAYEG
jgi:hypothetical protein